MTPQNICVSLEVAKELKELGFNRSTIFWWCNSIHTGREVIDTSPYLIFGQQGWCAYKALIPAPTCGELGEILPARIINPTTRNMDRLYFHKQHKGDDSKQDVRDGFSIEYHTPYSSPLVRTTSNTEADARGKMLIHLIKLGIVEVGE
jgi:hypothetical protein